MVRGECPHAFGARIRGEALSEVPWTPLPLSARPQDLFQRRCSVLAGPESLDQGAQLLVVRICPTRMSSRLTWTLKSSDCPSWVGHLPVLGGVPGHTHRVALAVRTSAASTSSLSLAPLPHVLRMSGAAGARPAAVFSGLCSWDVVLALSCFPQACHNLDVSWAWPNPPGPR